MKIKIPFVNKQIILDPIYEGLFILLGFYALFALLILAMSAFGASNVFIIASVLVFIHLAKTTKIEGVNNENE